MYLLRNDTLSDMIGPGLTAPLMSAVARGENGLAEATSLADAISQYGISIDAARDMAGRCLSAALSDFTPED